MSGYVRDIRPWLSFCDSVQLFGVRRPTDPSGQWPVFDESRLVLGLAVPLLRLTLLWPTVQVAESPVAHRRLAVGNLECKREGVYRLAALGVSSLLPDRFRPALTDFAWERPAVLAASPMSPGST